uniref:Uncharacterized protein n=1 Tax=uncultured bacterium contig00115 TaxID=1181577 RepID=A0A806KPQ2_9BACT|nr:hypothetical protein [uncultured bacterium contig00115]
MKISCFSSLSVFSHIFYENAICPKKRYFPVKYPFTVSIIGIIIKNPLLGGFYVKTCDM